MGSGGEPAGLRFTGHALVDVGIAGLCALAGKKVPETLTLGDLDAAGDFMPMASRRAEGRLLAVHADDPALTLRFARKYLDDNRTLLALALPTD